MVASQRWYFHYYNCLDCNNIPKWVQISFSMMKEKGKGLMRPTQNKEKNRTKWKDFIISKSWSLKIWQSGCSYGVHLSGYIGGGQWQQKAMFCGMIGVKWFCFWCSRCWTEKLWWEKQTCQRGWICSICHGTSSPNSRYTRSFWLSIVHFIKQVNLKISNPFIFYLSGCCS